ncbi:MAG: MarR family winged helix-turn-helix transcriptional regulator [Eubacteriales bacterium]|nr:MarR family winged helix-turn-helix transcriptional regulator [Eubacteriales bacterium]
MDQKNLKRLLDVCYVAKRVVETLPELPKGMKPRHIHVLEAIYEMQQARKKCRVSDVSASLNITTPSVTKLIQELESFGMLEKQSDKEDRRTVLLILTAKGMECVKRYVTDLHSEWAEAMGDVGEKQVEETIYLIGHLRDTMPGRKEGKNRNGR